MATSTAGVPVQVLHEAEGHNVTVELKNGEMYRGHLDASEDTMNVQLTNVVHTARDGRTTKLEHVYLRGSQVRFVVLPDILNNSPLFKKVSEVAAKAKPVFLGKGRGRGARAGSSRGRGK